MDNKIQGNTKRLPPNAGKGRPKGAPNKATKAFRETVTMLLEENAENVSRWLQSVAEGDEEKGIKPDPGKALDLMSKLAEYATPKLGRTELTGDAENPIRQEIEVKIVD